MAMAKAAKEGKIPVSKLKGAALQMYKSMTEEQLGHFANTPTKNLPEHSSKGRSNYKILYKK